MRSTRLDLKLAAESKDAIHAHINPITALLLASALGMSREFLEKVVEHYITMDKVSLADQVPIPVVAEGAVILSNR